jgi:hypothetical protein
MLLHDPAMAFGDSEECMHIFHRGPFVSNRRTQGLRHELCLPGDEPGQIGIPQIRVENGVVRHFPIEKLDRGGDAGHASELAIDG